MTLQPIDIEVLVKHCPDNQRVRLLNEWVEAHRAWMATGPIPDMVLERDALRESGALLNLDDVVDNHIIDVVLRSPNRRDAARVLGISEATIYRRMTARTAREETD